MPVARVVNEQRKTQQENLLERLLQEWRSPQTSEHAEPVIIEEQPGNDDRVNHLYVVWSDWGDLTPIERSKLVLQAYARLRGQDLANSVTLAMGLTPDEAEKVGIKID